MAMLLKSKATAVRMIVPRLPESDGLTSTMWRAEASSDCAGFLNSAARRQFSLAPKILNALVDSIISMCFVLSLAIISLRLSP